MRKLASIRRISQISPIEGADRIVRATIDGWQVVTQKGNFVEGDLCVFFEIDSFLPVEERYEFLRKACFKSTQHLGDGFRLKTIKLRGQLSQGLALPLSEFPEIGTGADWGEGTDVTDLLGVKKYEKAIPAQLWGTIKGNFPSFLRKTDQERVQNLTREIAERREEDFEITIKLDGSSMTVYRDAEGNVGVCSRNIDLVEDDNNIFWKAAKACGLVDFMRNQCKIPVAVQGELMGPGIQGNREKLHEHAFFIFDIFDIEEQKYLRPATRHNMYRMMRQLYGVRALHVPILNFGTAIDEILPTFDGLDDMSRILSYAEGSSLSDDVTREGLVFKSYNSPFTFKVIANSYLLAEAA